MSHCPTHVFFTSVTTSRQKSGRVWSVQCSMFNVRIEHQTRRLMTLNHPLSHHPGLKATPPRAGGERVVPTGPAHPQRQNPPPSTRKDTNYFVLFVFFVGEEDKPRNPGKDAEPASSLSMDEPLLTCGLLTKSTIYSIFKEQTGTTISPAVSIQTLMRRKK